MTDGEQEGWFERLSLAVAKVPFRVKLTLVWVAIFALLAWFFSLAQIDTQWIRDNVRYIASGLVWTLLLAVCAITLAVILATIGAVCRISSNPILVGVSGFYTSFFRGTPLIVQLFLIYLALPQVAAGLTQAGIGGPTLQQVVTLSGFQAGVLGLGLNYGAYMTEIFRAGIQSVPHGQWEAAQALGLPYSKMMRRIILPQATRVIIPPTGNEFIAMMKDTALVGFLGQAANSMEVFGRASLLGKADFRNLEALLVAAGVYWILTVIFSFFQARLERRVSRGYVRGAATTAKAQPQPTFMSGAPGGGESGATMVAIPPEDVSRSEAHDQG